ncbi:MULTISPECIES: cell division protein ZipA [unclassified Vibrio]|uniref:cell division protein ZipA n=1 Tax=unclassified Vibrio TaxID=2614977 RepID=UPI001110CC3E|nr:cell division protein ZipA [Vibrio sp. Hep-1b-8]TMX31879.1 cell division protein ZipA [Vibrio sp. Hep-1b-8]
MQELRFVLIIVGALAIAALLFHGLWTSKKEGKTKFGSKPLGKLDVENEESDVVPERAFAPEDDFEIIKKERKEPGFVAQEEVIADPLIDSYQDLEQAEPVQPAKREDELELEVPSISTQVLDEIEPIGDTSIEIAAESEALEVKEADRVEEAPLEVIVLNVHCSGDEPFIGTKLFESMQQNGLIYGEMDIFHRHADLSGTGKVLFSVANMMQPGTLQHDDPAEFSTKGISFFMTLPCYGDPDPNFKLMLKTAQQIADDLGANVLDDARNLMTPNRIDAYKAQIQKFKAAATA